MAETPRLDLPYLSASQAQKEIMHNVSLDRLDLLVQCVVLDRNLNTPPASPTLGDAYIVGPTPTGAWATHANHLALYINLQWQFIAPLPGFQCWVLDEAVQVGWSGSAWTITASGGAGATTLLALTDTPDAYGGQAGKTLLVNPGETGMVFGTVAGSAPVDATYIVSGSNATLSAERVVTDNAQITWDVSTAGQLKAALAVHGVTHDKLPQQPPGTLLGRGDSLELVDDVQVITVGAGLEIAGTTLTATGGGGGGSSDFLGLTDTPDTYSGQAGKAVLVNAGATALEFGTPAAGATTFLALTDSPDSYAGQAGKGVTVNGAATGLEFTTAVTGSYDLGVTWAGTLPVSQVLLRYPFPRAVDFPAGLTGSQGRAAIAATALTTLDLRKNGTSVGSVQFAAAGTTATFTMASATSFAAGDVLTVHAPGTADATLADLGLSLAGTRAVAAGEMGATTFLGLTDTPDVYASNALKILRVNAGATATEFGPVLGTLAQQDASAVAITDGRISLGGHTPTGVLDVQGSVEATDLPTYYLTARLWPVAPSGATVMRGLTVHAPGGAASTTASFHGLVVENPPVTSGAAYGLLSVLASGTNRYNVYANGTAQNYFAGRVGIGSGSSVPASDLDVSGFVRVSEALGLQGVPSGSEALTITQRRSLSQHGIQIKATGNDTGGYAIYFVNTSGTPVGTIMCTGAATAYNTSSDGRLKEAVAALPNALETIQQLLPVQFRWKATGEVGQGFVAQEVQPLVPLAVTGSPDDPEPTMQMDLSKLVPHLVGAVKELAQQVQALTARLEAAGA